MNSTYSRDFTARKLSDKEQNVYNLILKGHEYYKDQDKKFGHYVRCSKILILVLSVISTIVFGWKGYIPDTVKINIGLVLTAIISLTTAISAYFNFEKYWMRNIKCHIRFNILRDSFNYEATQEEPLSEERINYYFDELKKIQEENITYWQKAIDRTE